MGASTSRYYHAGGGGAAGGPRSPGSGDSGERLHLDVAVYGSWARDVTAELAAAHSEHAPFTAAAPALAWRRCACCGATRREGPATVFAADAVAGPVVLCLEGARVLDATAAVQAAADARAAPLSVSNDALGGDPHFGTRKVLLCCATAPDGRGVRVAPADEGATFDAARFATRDELAELAAAEDAARAAVAAAPAAIAEEAAARAPAPAPAPALAAADAADATAALRAAARALLAAPLDAAALSALRAAAAGAGAAALVDALAAAQDAAAADVAAAAGAVVVAAETAVAPPPPPPPARALVAAPTTLGTFAGAADAITASFRIGALVRGLSPMLARLIPLRDIEHEVAKLIAGVTLCATLPAPAPGAAADAPRELRLSLAGAALPLPLTA
jgi:hypothetical protein